MNYVKQLHNKREKLNILGLDAFLIICSWNPGKDDI